MFASLPTPGLTVQALILGDGRLTDALSGPDSPSALPGTKTSRLLCCARKPPTYQALSSAVYYSWCLSAAACSLQLHLSHFYTSGLPCRLLACLFHVTSPRGSSLPFLCLPFPQLFYTIYMIPLFKWNLYLCYGRAHPTESPVNAQNP
jgi:hypothetical protein